MFQTKTSSEKGGMRLSFFLFVCLFWNCLFWNCLFWNCLFWNCLFWNCLFWNCLFWNCLFWNCLFWNCLFWNCLFWNCLFCPFIVTHCDVVAVLVVVDVVDRSNFSLCFSLLTFYTQISVLIFSIFVFILFLWYWQGESMHLFNNHSFLGWESLLSFSWS